jgi:hypothetical protein
MSEIEGNCCMASSRKISDGIASFLRSVCIFEHCFVISILEQEREGTGAVVKFYFWVLQFGDIMSPLPTKRCLEVEAFVDLLIIATLLAVANHWNCRPSQPE